MDRPVHLVHPPGEGERIEDRFGQDSEEGQAALARNRFEIAAGNPRKVAADHWRLLTMGDGGQEGRGHEGLLWPGTLHGPGTAPPPGNYRGVIRRADTGSWRRRRLKHD